MNKVVIKRIPKPPNLKAYQERFGHRQSPEASRAYSRSQLDEMAKPRWRQKNNYPMERQVYDEVR
jgi:hypothetical protein